MGYCKGPCKGGEPYSNCRHFPTDFKYCVWYSLETKVNVYLRTSGENRLFHPAIRLVDMWVLVMFSALYVFLKCRRI